MQKQASISISKGALVTVAMRWVDRLIGIISTLILARILVPDDFGIVAMASVVVSLIDIIFDLGVNVSIIQRKNPEQKFYDTAWTLRIIQSFCVAVCLALSAPFAAQYYNDPRVTAVIQVMAIGLFIGALENIGTMNFQKNLDFITDFKFIFAKRIAGFCTTMILTLLWQSYWGMVVGAVCGRMVGVVLSYVMSAMRPRFSLRYFREIFSVSQWVLVKNISQYLDRNLHIIVVGGSATTAVTGGYTLANEIADIPGSELLAPINRVLFPAFARVKDDAIALKELFMLAQGVQFLVTVPTCIGFALTAKEFVPIALGDKWLFVVPFIQILALSNIIQSISSSGNYVLIVLGKIRLLAITSWLQIGFFVALAGVLFKQINPLLIAEIRLSAILLTFCVSYYLIVKNIHGVSVQSLIVSIWRPTLACLSMALVLAVIDHSLVLGNVAMLVIKVLAGVVTYSLVLLLLWIFSGKPESAERYLINKIPQRFKKL